MGKKIQSIGKYKFCYETLGKGSFARVELVVHEVTKCKVAMKIINTRKISDDYVRNNLYREARILSQLNHPNIIKFYESLKADVFYCLITECAFGGSLSDYMKTFDDKRFPEDVARYYTRQLISALQYIHERRVVHRDLKMENLLLDETKKHLKIIDFGLSNNLPRNDLLSTHCGSPEYAAPELFTNNATYGPEVDVWSFGIVFYTCVTGELPFSSPYYDHARRQRLLAIIKKGLVQRHLTEMQHLSPECQGLIKEVLEPLPQLRISVDEITTHAWLTNKGTQSFTPYFAKPRLPEMKTQIIEKLADLTSLKKIEVERFVHENGTNELSAMFKMLLEEAKIQIGYYDEDHTSRPISLVNERKRHLAQAKWRKLRCRLKESARIFKELVNNKNLSNSFTTSIATDPKDSAAFQKSEMKQKKIKRKVNPVGIVKTEKKKEFFPPKRNVLQPASSVEGKSQFKAVRSRLASNVDSRGDPKQMLVLSDPSPSRRSSFTPPQKGSSSATPLLQSRNSENKLQKSRSSYFPENDLKNVKDDTMSKSFSRITYRPVSKRADKNTPPAPLANIDELNLGILETTTSMDEFEPRYCLVRVTDGELSSGVMLSSTISEISDAKSIESNLELNSISLETKENKVEVSPDLSTQTVIFNIPDAPALCNGDISVKEQCLSEIA